MFQMGVFEEHFIGVSARDTYYQKERVSTRNGAEWDVAFLRVCVCVCVTADTTGRICKRIS